MCTANSYGQPSRVATCVGGHLFCKLKHSEMMLGRDVFNMAARYPSPVIEGMNAWCMYNL